MPANTGTYYIGISDRLMPYLHKLIFKQCRYKAIANRRRGACWTWYLLNSDANNPVAYGNVPEEGI